MRILIVCSGNSGKVVPFISDQVNFLIKKGYSISYFHIEGKGIFGYLKNIKRLKATITKVNPDIIHAHYGLSGLLATLQRKTPVVVTYHGSDINNRKYRIFSHLAIKRANRNIFVSQHLFKLAGSPKKSSILPCGVDTKLFKPMDKSTCREKLGLNAEGKYILFSSSFLNKIKNPELALSTVDQLNDVILLELKDYTRKEVSYLMNAVDVCLMTSHSEGSPQFIKEAMATNTPIVTTDVGDVKWLLEDTLGAYVVDKDTFKLKTTLIHVLEKNIKDITLKNAIFNKGLDQKSTILQLESIYEKALS